MELPRYPFIFIIPYSIAKCKTLKEISRGKKVKTSQDLCINDGVKRERSANF
jgi:hypothetical protein